MYSTTITLEIHYGGTFTWNPVTMYFGCQIYLKTVDSDLMSWFELVELLKEDLG